MLEAACTDYSLDNCLKKIGINKSKVVHLLVHVTSTAPYTDSSVCYASQAALNVIVRNKGNEAKRRMSELLSSCQGNPLIAALCGYIFEPYAILNCWSRVVLSSAESWYTETKESNLMKRH